MGGSRYDGKDFREMSPEEIEDYRREHNLTYDIKAYRKARYAKIYAQRKALKGAKLRAVRKKEAALQRKYYAEHADEKMREYNRLYQQRYRDAHREELNEYKRQWEIDNPKKIAKYRKNRLKKLAAARRQKKLERESVEIQKNINRIIAND